MGPIVGFLGKLVDAAKGLPGVVRDVRRKRILRSMLKDPTFEWRKLDTLARAIGAPEEKTRELLIDIGARAATSSGAELWALTSEVGAAGTRRSDS
jgi:hypothetical protein